MDGGPIPLSHGREASPACCPLRYVEHVPVYRNLIPVPIHTPIRPTHSHAPCAMGMAGVTARTLDSMHCHNGPGDDP